MVRRPKPRPPAVPATARLSRGWQAMADRQRRREGAAAVPLPAPVPFGPHQLPRQGLVPLERGLPLPDSLQAAAGATARDRIAMSLEPTLPMQMAPQATEVNILIVDDDSRNLFAVRETLEDLGATLVLAKSGEEALKQLLLRDFALILLDVHMPGMDGYETAETIRKREKCRHIPIIFLTAINKDEMHVFRGYSAGAVDYMFKPVDPQVLKHKVAVFIELFRKTEEIRRQVEARERLLEENYRVRMEKLQAEQALRRSEERQALILRQLPIVLYTAEAGPGLPFRFVSDNVDTLFGFPADRFTGEAGFWEERMHPDDRARVQRQMAGILDTGVSTSEYRWRCADGSERHLLDQAVVVRDEQGRPRELFGTILDVTETRLIQQQLAHAQKMEMVGQLTGGIAHDFNNMLMVVIGSLERLGRSSMQDEASARRTDMALQAALRCSDMTRRLLTFARRQPLNPEPVDLRELVGGMGELLERTLGRGIEIAIEAEDDGPGWPAQVDRSQAESALLNLVINARDAMGEAGRLIIRTGSRSIAEPQEGYGMRIEAGDYVTLSVSDSGCGMAPEVLERAFEPFFTTKETGKGTGLGLSMIYGFVKQSNGLIRIDSEIGVGTSFHLFLPRAAGPAITAPDPEAGAMVVGRGETVLVVDDDSDVRKVAVQAVRELGYAVIEADGAAAALAVLDSGQTVDLLFTDIVMPGGMNGRELAREGQKRRPGLPVLFASGYAAGAAASLDAGIGQAETLAKPYRGGDLARALRRALDEGRAATGEQSPARRAAG